MTNELIKKNYKDIADSIRNKTGENGLISPEEMPGKIEAIETGIEPSGTLDITANGEYDITEKAGVNVNVPNPSTGTLEITENGVYNVTEKASVDVDVPVPEHTMDIEYGKYYQACDDGSISYDGNDKFYEGQELESEYADSSYLYQGKGYTYYRNEDEYPLEQVSDAQWIEGGLYEFNGGSYVTGYGEYVPRRMNNGWYLLRNHGSQYDMTNFSLPEVGGDPVTITLSVDGWTYTFELKLISRES